MRIWKELLICLIGFWSVDIIFELVKNMAVGQWMLIWVTLAIFIVCWGAVFMLSKSLEHKMPERYNSWLSGFIYFVMIWSACIPFDTIEYLLENNMLNKYYFFGVALTCMFVGWAVGRLDRILPQRKKKTE